MSESDPPPEDFSLQRMEAINRLAAGVAHEFNNVLQIVRGYVTFARDSLSDDDAQARSDLDNALEATGRAAELASGLLHFARSDDGAVGAVDVNEAVRSLHLMLRPIIGENVRVSCELAETLSDAAVNSVALRQALLNLCVNARDAMPEGGELRLETSLETGGPAEPQPGAETVVGELETREYVRVAVTDTGEGMTEATRERLFEPLYTTKPSGQGTGLGLPMVAHFVESSGGAIVLTSRLGEGAKFELYLPASVEDDPDAGSLESLSASDLAGQLDPSSLAFPAGV